MALIYWFYQPNLERFGPGYQSIRSSHVTQIVLYNTGNNKIKACEH